MEYDVNCCVYLLPNPTSCQRDLEKHPVQKVSLFQRVTMDTPMTLDAMVSDVTEPVLFFGCTSDL